MFKTLGLGLGRGIRVFANFQNLRFGPQQRVQRAQRCTLQSPCSEIRAGGSELKLKGVFTA